MIQIGPDPDMQLRPGVLLNQKYSLHAIARYRGTRVMPPRSRKWGALYYYLMN